MAELGSFGAMAALLPGAVPEVPAEFAIDKAIRKESAPAQMEGISTSVAAQVRTEILRLQNSSKSWRGGCRFSVRNKRAEFRD